ncbi:MAG: Holliday junction branch migration protein RuvA [Planctomycetota bacterium]|nr:Holliday junction branch migration protein RuvA [Planctomycetota bacterium]
MYEFIEGTIEVRSATSVVVAAAGVGYELLAPLGAPFPAPGETARVHVHLVVREDAQTLYGFPSRDDRDLFRILLRVRGVGPSMALGVLSGMSAPEIAAAVARDNLKAFTSIKGVGKKTAEQILLDLRDKSALLASVAGAAPAAPKPLVPGEDSAPPNLADAITALVSIGYSEKEATKKAEAAADEVGTEDLEALVRAAMRA